MEHSFMHKQGKETFSQETAKKPFYFPSNLPDHFIKNAMTGVIYPWRVGSLDASRLFKVVDTIGNYDSSGFKIKPSSTSYPNSSPNHCYYDSPQQFMTHRKMTLQPEVVERWETVQEGFAERDY
jgi:hypothetical protein